MAARDPTGGDSGLVGRDGLLSDLHDAAIATATSRRGSGQVVLGEPGIGKSALVDALAASLPDGCHLVGRCMPPPASVRRPLAEIAVAAVSAGAAVATVEESLFGAGLRVLFARSDGEHTGGEHALLVAEGLRHLLATIDTGRLTVTIEDAHWADDETLDILEYLVDHLDDSAIVLVVTARPRASQRLDDLVAEWQRRGAADVRVLEPLDETETGSLLAAELGGDVPTTLVTAVHLASDGIPLLVSEFARQAVVSGAVVLHDAGWRYDATMPLGIPPSYRAAVSRSLGALDPEQRTTLQLAALCGRSIDETLLARLGTEPELAARSIEAGERVHLIEQPAHDALPQFRHALTQDAVAWSLTDAARQALATRALASLGAGGSRGVDLDVESRLARASGDTRAAWELQIDSARQAVESGAGATALARLDEADQLATADLRHHPDALELRLRALSQVGRAKEAIALAEELLDTVPPAERAARLPRVVVALARAAGSIGDWVGAAHHLDTELGRHDAAAPALLAYRGIVAMELGDPARARDAASRALAAGATGPARCEAFEVLGRVARESDFAAAAEHFRAGVSAAADAGLELWHARSLMELGLCEATVHGRPDAFEEAHRRAVSTGAVFLAAMLEYNLANFRCFAFDDRALTTARSAARTAERIGASKLAAMCTVVTGQAHALAARRAEARIETDSARRAAGDDDEIRGMAAGVDGLAALLAGDFDAAGAAFEESLQLLCELPLRTATGPWYFGPVVLASSGHPLTAAVRDQLAHPGFSASPHLSASGLLIDAIVAGRGGDVATADAAAAELREWVATHSSYFGRIAGPLHLLHATAAASALAAGWGTPVEDLRAANSWFRTRGLDAPADWCASMLRDAGVGPRRRGRAKVALPDHLRDYGITKREYDVLLLLGERLTNKEIAERLTVSASTVKSHVERLLAKTGRGGRSELAELAALDVPERPPTTTR